MILIATNHLKVRMKQRGITMDQIEFVLTAHDFSVPSKKGGTEIWRTFPDGRQLKVWVTNELPLGNRVIIKSASWREI